MNKRNIARVYMMQSTHMEFDSPDHDHNHHSSHLQMSLLHEIDIPASHFPIQIIKWKEIAGQKVEKDQELGMYEITDGSSRIWIRGRFEGIIKQSAVFNSIC
jgi:hypothetical protein